MERAARRLPRKCQDPRQETIPYRREVIPEGALMMEGAYGAVNRLMHQQVVEIFVSTFEVDASEP